MSSNQQKIQSALEILKIIGVPKAQQNERSALTLLALVDVKPDSKWHDAKKPLRGITEMMDYFKEFYDVEYAPNTRETVRRQTIHQFWEMDLIIPNPDQPDRPINSPKYCYQIDHDFLKLIKSYGSPNWQRSLEGFLLSHADSLRNLKPKERQLNKIPVNLPDGTTRKLTAGGQNILIKKIVEEFCPRFTPSGEIFYMGDAGEKLNKQEQEAFKALGIELNSKGKMPDVVVYMPDKAWLVLIEAVTSHGPIDQKRHNELRSLFTSDKVGLVYVTTFKTRKTMMKYLTEISWETEVWVSDAPDHLIHFDGERFLGPY